MKRTPNPFSPHRTVTWNVPRLIAGRMRFVAEEWQPDKPHRLSHGEICQYLAHQHEFASELAGMIGRPVYVQNYDPKDFTPDATRPG